MDREPLLEQLKQALVVHPERPPLPRGNIGAIVVDVVRGFTRGGNLADPDSMVPMVHDVDHLLRELDRRVGPRLHVLALRDCHAPDIPEPPYPPHCIAGTGEEQLDPQLAWLERRATVVSKDCINGFVGAMRPVQHGGQTLWRNELTDWIVERQLTAIVVLGDCTDICVSDLTVALLSARNHGMLTRATPGDRQAYVDAVVSLPVYVHVDACATFDLDPAGPMPDGSEPLRHPGPIAHHVGLWLMASRGARLIDGFATE